MYFYTIVLIIIVIIDLFLIYDKSKSIEPARFLPIRRSLLKFRRNLIEWGGGRFSVIMIIYSVLLGHAIEDSIDVIATQIVFVVALLAGLLFVIPIMRRILAWVFISLFHA